MKPLEALACAGIAALGAVLLAANLDLPLLRNSLVYARMVDHLLATDLAVGAVTNDFALSYGRPVGFPLLAAPLVAALGAQHGLLVTGYLSTLPLVVACWAFFRRFNPRFGLPDRWIPAELLLTFASPLVLYQFWAAYPDALFTAIVLAVVMLLDRILLEPDRTGPGLVGLLAVTTVAGMVLKHYGLILLPMIAWMVVLHRRSAVALLSRPATALAVLGSAVAMGLLLGLARVGRNPLLNLDSRAGGLDGFVGGIRSGSLPVLNNLAVLAAFLLLGFHVALPLLARRPRLRAEAWAPVSVLGVYALGLVAYYDTWFNARFFLPLVPLVALLVVRAYQDLAIGRAWKRAGVGVFAAIACLLSANYNSRTVYAALAPVNHAVEHQRRARNFVDSLRMGAHLEVRRALDSLNTQAPHGQRVYYVSTYNGDAAHGVYARDGLLRGDLAVEYVADAETVLRRAAPGETVLVFTPREELPPVGEIPADVARRLALRALGEGVYLGVRAAGS